MARTLFRAIQCLSPVEKELLANKFIEWDWDIGSPQILRCYQLTGTLNAAEYIAAKHAQDPQMAQLIFNDLLETEYSLLAGLMEHIGIENGTSSKVTEIVREGLKDLCTDISEDPTVLQKNHLLELRPFLSGFKFDIYEEFSNFDGLKLSPTDEIYERSKSLHLAVFLEQTDRSKLTDAIRYQKRWNDEFTSDGSNLKSLLASVIDGDGLRRFAELLRICESSEFRCWKWWGFLIQVCVSDCKESEASEMRRIAKGNQIFNVFR